MLKIFLPLLSLFLLIKLLPTKFLWHTLSLSLIAAALLYTLIMRPPWPATITPFSLFSSTTISTSLSIITIWISALIILARYKTLLSKAAAPYFLTTILILTLTLLLTFNTNNISLFYIFFEASLIPTFILILTWGYQPERLQARIYLILYTVTASLPLLLNILYTFGQNAHLSFLIPVWTIPLTSFVLILWWFLSIIAFLVKIPVFFFHLWLPKAHVEAPVAGSIVLAGILLKLGSYGLLRFAFFFSFLNSTLAPFLGTLCMWGATLTSLICIRQTDLKALIAYSSIGHIGILTAGITTSTSWGWNRALTIILAHGLCSSNIFILANITYSTTNTRRIYLTKGLIRATPAVSMWWFLTTAANIAAPPSINLFAEISLLTALLSKSQSSFFLIALLRFLTAAYSLHLFTSIHHGPHSPFINPLLPLSFAQYTPILLHLLPLTILLLKAEVISLWI